MPYLQHLLPRPPALLAAPPSLPACLSYSTSCPAHLPYLQHLLPRPPAILAAPPALSTALSKCSAHLPCLKHLLPWPPSLLASFTALSTRPANLLLQSPLLLFLDLRECRCFSSRRAFSAPAPGISPHSSRRISGRSLHRRQANASCW